MTDKATEDTTPATRSKEEITADRRKRVEALLAQNSPDDTGDTQGEEGTSRTKTELKAIIAKQLEANPNQTTAEMLELIKLQNSEDFNLQRKGEAPPEERKQGTMSRAEELEWKFEKHQNPSDDFTMRPEELTDHSAMPTRGLACNAWF